MILSTLYSWNSSTNLPERSDALNSSHLRHNLQPIQSFEGFGSWLSLLVSSWLSLWHYFAPERQSLSRMVALYVLLGNTWR